MVKGCRERSRIQIPLLPAPNPSPAGCPGSSPGQAFGTKPWRNAGARHHQLSQALHQALNLASIHFHGAGLVGCWCCGRGGAPSRALHTLKSETSLSPAVQDSRCSAVDVMGTWRGYLWPGLLHRANPAPYSCRQAKRKRLRAFCKGLAELAVPLSQKLCLNCELSQAEQLLPFNSC